MGVHRRQNNPLKAVLTLIASDWLFSKTVLLAAARILTHRYRVILPSKINKK